MVAGSKAFRDVYGRFVTDPASAWVGKLLASGNRQAAV